jgi:hypothetical protein
MPQKMTPTQWLKAHQAGERATKTLVLQKRDVKRTVKAAARLDGIRIADTYLHTIEDDELRAYLAAYLGAASVGVLTGIAVAKAASFTGPVGLAVGALLGGAIALAVTHRVVTLRERRDGRFVLAVE